MPAKPRLTPSQWAEIRRIWEADSREGYAWIVKEVELEVSPAAVRKKALSEGWKKGIKSIADNNLKRGEPKKTKNTETPPKPPVRKGAKSSTRRGKEGGNSDASKGGRGRKVPPPKQATKRPGRKGFKKSEASRPEGSGNHQAEGSLSEGYETLDAEDKENQWVGRTEIDVVRDTLGRPPVYRHEYAEQARKLCLLGATDEQIADFFEVSVRTIYRWKIEHPEFCHAVKQGKMVADAEVANALYHRAIGMRIPKTHVSTYLGKVILTDMVETIPPDVGAARMWLTNRHPDLWRNDPEPAPADPSSKMPSATELEDLYSQSREVSRARAMEQRERNERLGIVTGANSIPADATIKPKRNVQARVPAQEEEGGS